MSVSEGGLLKVEEMELERSSPLNLRTATRSGSVSPTFQKKIPSRKMLLLRISRASVKKEEMEEEDEEDEGAPLDLSCPGRRSSSSGVGDDFRVTKSRGDSCSSSSSIEWNREYTEEDSDDSDGQPMDLGINPKAYKKSLMKRYRKSLFGLSHFVISPLSHILQPCGWCNRVTRVASCWRACYVGIIMILLLLKWTGHRVAFFQGK